MLFADESGITSDSPGIDDGFGVRRVGVRVANICGVGDLVLVPEVDAKGTWGIPTVSRYQED